MAQKPIREADGMRMMARLLGSYSDGRFTVDDKFVTVTPDTDLAGLPDRYEWLTEQKLVVKPDQLIKRRGKNGLILVGASFDQAKSWIEEKAKAPITIHGEFDAEGRPTDEGTFGRLTHFLVEPMFAHDEADECYVAIMSERTGDDLLFHHQGGIHVGDVEAKAARMHVPVGEFPSAEQIRRELLAEVCDVRCERLAGFLEALFRFYADLNFTLLEINPLVVTDDAVIPLDLAAKLDSAADFESGRKWGDIEFSQPFGQTLTKEEAFIEGLDAKTGASLKLTVLNPEGRVWTMVAGGGASVIFADTITDLGYMDELANYGEYSGDPSEEFTYLYAKTILELMTRTKNPKGKYLLIGGGIANFTDVANTFKGIIRALREYKRQLQDGKVRIFVRRGGPNYREGLRMMRALGDELAVPIEVYGPETHMTKIVSMALKAG
jgi:ATP citrate (pro-S)-lyase